MVPGLVVMGYIRKLLSKPCGASLPKVQTETYTGQDGEEVQTHITNTPLEEVRYR